jgi:hypothetical protein
MEDTQTLVTDFMRDAADLAHRAIAQDKEDNYEIAIYFYRESISLLDRMKTEVNRLVTILELEDSTSSNENNENGGSETSLSSGGPGRNAEFWKEKLLMAEKKMVEYDKRITELEIGIKIL